MRGLLLLLLLSIVASAAACWQNTPDNGTLKCSSDPKPECPDNYKCVQGYCYRSNTDFAIAEPDGGT